MLEQALFRHVSPPTRGVRLARPKKSSRALSTSPFPWFVAAHDLGCELSSFSKKKNFFFFFFSLFFFFFFMVLPTWEVGKWSPPPQKLNGSPSWHVHEGEVGHRSLGVLGKSTKNLPQLVHMYSLFLGSDTKAYPLTTDFFFFSEKSTWMFITHPMLQVKLLCSLGEAV